MPKMNGFVFTKKLLKQLPAIKVVIVSDDTDKTYAQLAANVGAIAFIPKKQLSLESFAKVHYQRKALNGYRPSGNQ